MAIIVFNGKVLMLQERTMAFIQASASFKYYECHEDQIWFIDLVSKIGPVKIHGSQYHWGPSYAEMKIKSYTEILNGSKVF